MNLEQASNIITNAVEADPTLVYKRIKVLFGTDFRNFTPGLEYNKQSKRLMVEYLTEKARLSGNIDQFIAQL